MRLTGRAALVTGGAMGLGRSHALALAKEGANVAVMDLGDGHRDAEPGYALPRRRDLDATVADVRGFGVTALGLVADVRDQAAVDAGVARAIAELGRVDVLVANAGVAISSPSWTMTEAEWQLTMDVNLSGVWRSCRAVIPHMIERGYGRIVLIASINAWKAVAGLGAYGASKAGVIGLTRMLALELAEHGVTVNAVCPSTVPAGTGRGVAARMGLPAERFYEDARADQPMKRLVEAADVSHAVVFFACEESRNITGVALPIDGGVTL